MSREPLVSSAIQEKPLSELPLISRYNIFVENYNKPNCQIVGKVLDKLPQSNLHNTIFLVLTDWRGKMLYFTLLFIPVLDCLQVLVAMICVAIYWHRLSIHEKNMLIIDQPTKNMVFDPELCYKLRKDYYSFTIEFKQLEGFSLNYNKDMRKQLSLREERGKANFMIYNTNFWASYHHFGKWKQQHLTLLLASLAIATALNLIIFIFLF